VRFAALVALALPFARALSGAAGPTKTPSSLQDLMLEQLDPSADALWAAVGSVVTLKGETTRAPRSESEWNALRGRAEALAAGARRLREPGWRVLPLAGARASADLRDDAEVERRIGADPAVFAGFAAALGVATAQAQIAIERHDAAALTDAGDEIEQACEACHLAFWYPSVRSGP
jgi:hypothetical protein